MLTILVTRTSHKKKVTTRSAVSELSKGKKVRDIETKDDLDNDKDVNHEFDKKASLFLKCDQIN